MTVKAAFARGIWTAALTTSPALTVAVLVRIGEPGRTSENETLILS
jgi:hypothetical protein